MIYKILIRYVNLYLVIFISFKINIILTYYTIIIIIINFFVQNNVQQMTFDNSVLFYMFATKDEAAINVL